MALMEIKGYVFIFLCTEKSAYCMGNIVCGKRKDITDIHMTGIPGQFLHMLLGKPDFIKNRKLRFHQLFQFFFFKYKKKLVLLKSLNDRIESLHILHDLSLY